MTHKHNLHQTPFKCESTQIRTEFVWSDHKRWKTCGYSHNSCEHCNPDGPKNARDMLNKLNKEREENQ